MDADNTTAIENLISAPASATVDGQSASSKSAADAIEAVVFAEGRSEYAGTNARGGLRSGFSMLRRAKAVLPGTQ